MSDKLSNPIEEYLVAIDKQGHKFDQLLTEKGEDISAVDMKTELSEDEVKLCTALLYNDDYLASKGIRPVYGSYVQRFMRLQVSKNRQSRKEYVDVHRAAQPDNFVDGGGQLPFFSGGGVPPRDGGRL